MGAPENLRGELLSSIGVIISIWLIPHIDARLLLYGFGRLITVMRTRRRPSGLPSVIQFTVHLGLVHHDCRLGPLGLAQRLSPSRQGTSRGFADDFRNMPSPSPAHHRVSTRSGSAIFRNHIFWSHFSCGRERRLQPLHAPTGLLLAWDCFRVIPPIGFSFFVQAPLVGQI